MRVVVMPFAAAPSEAVIAGSWLDGDEPLPAALPDWDFNSALKAHRTIAVDAAMVANACDLPTEAELALSVVWQSSTTGLRGRACRHRLPPDAGPIQLSVRLDGPDLGGTVTLTTLLVLADSVPATGFAPRLAGSVLWRDVHRVAVEGSATLFPTEAVDFNASSPFPSGAGWYLKWSPDDLQAPALGAIRLFVNRMHPAVRRAVETASAPDPEGRAILSALRFDVSRSLLTGALRRDEFISQETEYGEASLGRALHRLIAIHWPGESPQTLRNRLETQPALLDAELQERFKLFGG
jgi:hypothetical protein